MLQGAKDQTLGPADVLKIVPRVALVPEILDRPRWLWMKSGDYLQFDSWGRERYHVQAVELDPPKRSAKSIRYQFQSCIASNWPVRIEEFKLALLRSTEHSFSTIKAGNYGELAYRVETHWDMPVAVRIPT